MGLKVGICISLDGLAALATKQGEPERAAHLAGAADALRKSISLELVPVDRLFRDRYVAELRATLGDEAFSAVVGQGRMLRMKEAIALALEVSGMTHSVG